MVDSVLAYGIQFATILAVAMGLTEWFTIPVGPEADPKGESLVRRNGLRKPLSAFVYSLGLGLVGVYANLVVPPVETDSFPEVLAFVSLLSLANVVLATVVVQGRKGAATLLASRK